MAVFNVDLEDGQPPVSFVLNLRDAERFQRFMAECSALTAERDALRARVAELEADLKPQPGRCELGEALCNCGGDVPAIREGCAYWKAVPNG